VIQPIELSKSFEAKQKKSGQVLVKKKEGEEPYLQPE
jgi:hypothetical protein